MTTTPRFGSRALRVLGLCGALLALTLASVPASARPSAPKVEILFVTPDALTDFAMDGDQVAWIGERRRRVNEDVEPCGRVSGRPLSGGPTYTITPRRDAQYGDVCAAEQVALAGRRVFWLAGYGGNTTCERVDTALVGAATSRILGTHCVDYSGGSFGDELAGDAGTFAYSWGMDVRKCDDNDLCETVREIPHVDVLRNGKQTRFRLGSRPSSIAVAAGRVATVEAVPRADESEIVVYTPAGRVVRRLKESGFVAGLGISSRWVAAVTASGRSRQLRVFDARSGAIAVAAELPTRSSRFQVAVSGTHAAVATGRTVWTLDIAAKSLTLLAQRPYLVRGLSIEGSRVAWGERTGTRGRVVSTLLG